MPAKTKTPAAINIGRAASFGLVAIETFREQPNDFRLAEDIGFDTHVSRLAEVVEAAGRAATSIEQDDTLTTKGKVKRREAVAREATTQLLRVSEHLVKAVEHRIEASISEHGDDGRTVGGRDVLLDFNSGRVDVPLLLAHDLGDRMALVRRELLKLKGEDLLAALREAAESGDSLTWVSIDTLPEWLRSRLFARAAIDEGGANALRRTYRRARDPERATALAAVAKVGTQVSYNICAVASQLEGARLVDHEGQASVRKLTGRIAAALNRAGHPIDQA